MVDLNQWWRMPGDIERGLGPAEARRVIERLRDYGVLWVEEPLAGEDLAGMRSLREQTGVRIAGGEMARTFEELRAARWTPTRSTSTSPTWCSPSGSPARARWPSWPCGATGGSRRTPGPTGSGCWPICTCAPAWAAARYLEFPYDPPGWTPERRDFMLAEPVTVGPDGTVSVPDAPGLGARLDEEAVAFYARAGDAVGV